MSEHDGATPAGFGVRAAIARARQVATQKTSRWSHASDASSDFHDVAWVVLFVLIKLRDGLVDLRNQADDSDAEPPQPGGGAPYLAAQFAYQQTLAYFDNRAAAEPEAFNYKGEGGKASALLAVLQAKDQQYRREQEEAANRGAEASTSVEVAEADTAHDGLAPEAPPAIEPNGPERTDLDRWRTRVANVARRLEQARRWFRLRGADVGRHSLAHAGSGSRRDAAAA